MYVAVVADADASLVFTGWAVGEVDGEADEEHHLSSSFMNKSLQRCFRVFFSQKADYPYLHNTHEKPY